MAPVVGYWDIRGYGEPIRLILHHLGIDFEDKRYAGLDDFAKSKWFDEKDTLGMEFPNLPYFIDGDIKVTQSLVIVRYLAQKHGLVPSSEQGKIKAEILEQTSRDVLLEMDRIAFEPPDETKESAEYRKKKVLDIVRRLSENLGDKQWFVEDKLSYADFLMVESLDQLSYLYPQILKDYPNIGAIIKRLQGLPNVEKYIQGGKFKAWPLHGTFARWGGSGDPPKREF